MPSASESGSGARGGDRVAGEVGGRHVGAGEHGRARTPSPRAAGARSPSSCDGYMTAAASAQERRQRVVGEVARAQDRARRRRSRRPRRRRRRLPSRAFPPARGAGRGTRRRRARTRRRAWGGSFAARACPTNARYGGAMPSAARRAWSSRASSSSAGRKRSVSTPWWITTTSPARRCELAQARRGGVAHADDHRRPPCRLGDRTPEEHHLRTFVPLGMVEEREVVHGDHRGDAERATGIV